MVRLRRMSCRNRTTHPQKVYRNGAFSIANTTTSPHHPSPRQTTPPSPLSLLLFFAFNFCLTHKSTKQQTFACKKCRKTFRKDASTFEESDEYCPHCDNHFVLEAKTAKPMLKFEGEDARIDSRMIKDDRLRQEEERTIFDVKEAPNKLG